MPTHREHPLMSSLDTPMMRQYLEVKAQRPDCLLLMRMGDFFECFLQDAEDLSRICGVALTCRNRDAADPIPMAGVPHHSIHQHIPKLLAAGRRVAMMDQLEDPKDAKGLVKRGLTRVITPGTLVDEDTLDPGTANILVALTGLDGVIGVAALDVSTGRFTVEECQAGTLAQVLARLQPAELVLPDVVRHAEGTAAALAALLPTVPLVASLPPYAWKGEDARRHLCARLRVGDLDGFGIGRDEDHLAIAAAAALRYAEGSLQVQDGGATGLAHVRALSRLHHADHLVLDATCRRNLDLLRNSRDGGRAGTLLATVDRTRTAVYSRCMHAGRRAGNHVRCATGGLPRTRYDTLTPCRDPIDTGFRQVRSGTHNDGGGHRFARSIAQDDGRRKCSREGCAHAAVVPQRLRCR